MSEKTIEIKICKHCQSSFEITDKDLELYDKISPSFPSPDSLVSGLKKIQIPSPTLCPDCRQQRRLSFRNERNLYRRKCDATGKQIISIYSPDKKYKVYNSDFWWSDKWDAMNYGLDFDFNKSFFEQFDNLMKEVPRLQNYQTKNEDSEYTNGTAYNNNCYLIFVSDHNENSLYCEDVFHNQNLIDCSDCTNCEHGFYCVGCKNCYSGKYLIDCYDCSNCSFCFDCKNSNDCFLSVGLRNKSYMIRNIQYTREDYLEEMKKYGNLTFGNIKKLFSELLEIKKTFPHLNFHGNSNENTLGDYNFNCKDSYNIYSSHDAENCKNSIFCNQAKNCHDCYVAVDNCELIYENVSSIGLVKSAFNFGSWVNCNNLYYTDHSQNCNNLFGCIGLKNKSYCILNKQYEKNEYEKLVPKIIEHMQKNNEWGEYFPVNISPFGYNESASQEYFPISKEKALKDNFNWSEYESPLPKVDKIIPANKLPESIKDIPDDILNWAIECEVTNKPFRILKQELDFYRKHNLPIPRRHPEQRHLDRIALKNPKKMFDRKCDKCGKTIKTSYYPNTEELVYCEECYNKEIY
ncbi:MAG: hypothetical protein WC850_05280 [Candidatus Gracilibacteria bacterium]